MQINKYRLLKKETYILVQKSDYVSKDKIKEKIKQLDEEGTKLYWYEEIIEMFKELLEE